MAVAVRWLTVLPLRRRAKEKGVRVLPEAVFRTGPGFKQVPQDRYFHIRNLTSLKLGVDSRKVSIQL